MRDYETIIKALDLPTFFKTHPVIENRRGWDCEGLEAHVMRQISHAELHVLYTGVSEDRCFIRELVPEVLNVQGLMQGTLFTIRRKVLEVEDRTRSEGRLKPEKLIALTNDNTKSVFQVWKELHDLEQGARKRQSGQTKAIKERDAEIEKLQAALQAAQIALAEALQKQ